MNSKYIYKFYSILLKVKMFLKDYECWNLTFRKEQVYHIYQI